MFPDRSSGFTSVLRDSPRGEEDGISISDLDPIGTSSRVFKIRKRRVNFKEHARRTEERRWYRGARKCYGVQGTREEGVNDHGGWTQEPRRKATIRCTALLAAATILFLRLNACWRNSTFSVRTNFTNPDLSPRGGSLEPRIMPQPCTLPIVLSLRNFSRWAVCLKKEKKKDRTIHDCVCGIGTMNMSTISVLWQLNVECGCLYEQRK